MYTLVTFLNTSEYLIHWKIAFADGKEEIVSKIVFIRESSIEVCIKYWETKD